MKIYEALKKATKNGGRMAAIGIVAALPYICDSCAYSNHKASAAEIKPATLISQQAPQTLETVVEE